MNNYFVEHLRDLRRESLVKAEQLYIKEVDRQLMAVMDRIPQARENMRQQARDLVQKVGYCFLIDLSDINERYPNLKTPEKFYQELEIIRRALQQEFPGMDITLTTTENTVMYTVSAEL